MSCKYVILFEPKIKNGLCEGEKEIKEAIAILLPSNTKNDQQAVRKWRKIRNKLEQRAKEIHQIRLCKILR